MPHLTPMNWILAMLMIWITISMMNSMYWWKSPMKFLNQHTHNKYSNTNNWKWMYTSWPK